MDDRPLRLLIVDDSARVRTAVRDLVEAVGGVEVVGVAADGAEAVALADALRPDVVLIDLAMPVMNGIEATHRITAANRGVRVVVLTAVRGREAEAREAGAAAHLLKDSTPAEIVRCLRAAGDR